MAEGLFLVERTSNMGDNNKRDAITAVVINNDDGDTDAQHIAAAVLAVNGDFPPESGFEDKIPAGYFDTVREISDLTSGPLATALDHIVFTQKVVEVVT